MKIKFLINYLFLLYYEYLIILIMKKNKWNMIETYVKRRKNIMLKLKKYN